MPEDPLALSRPRLSPWATPRRRMHVFAWIMAIGAAIAVVASWSSTNTPMRPYGYGGLVLLLVGLAGAGVSWIQVWARWLKARRNPKALDRTTS